jgi:hypothetical protein
MKVIAIGILMFLQPVTLRWWRVEPNGRDLEYVTRNTLVHHHDRVCGEILAAHFNDGRPNFPYATMRSGGARMGIVGEAPTQEEAKAAVEQDCK